MSSSDTDLERQLEADLARSLAAAARRAPVPPADLAKVSTIARRRGRQERLARVAAVVVAAALLGGVVVSRVGGGSTPLQLSAQDGTISLGKVDVVWSTKQPTTSLGGATAVSAGDGRVYALSTAAGQRSNDTATPRVLWSSSDGVDWSTLSKPSDLYVADLAPRGQRIYAVGTGPATVQGGRLSSPAVIGWSDDPAAGWTRKTLDIDLAAINSASLQAVVQAPKIAVSDAGLVVVASVSATPDVAKLLPAGTDLSHGWALSADGIDVLAGKDAKSVCTDGVLAGTDEAVPVGQPTQGPVCAKEGKQIKNAITAQDAYGVAKSFSWSSLGVTGDVLAAFTGQPFVFRADADGGSLQRVDVGITSSVSYVTLLGSKAGFDLLVNAGDGTTSTVHSADGRSWSAGSPLPGGIQWVTAAGQLGERSVLIGDGANGPTVAIAGPDGWESAESLTGALNLPAGAQAYIGSAAVGPYGIVAAVGWVVSKDGRESVGSPTWRVLVSRDGRTWEAFDPSVLAGETVANISQVVVTAQGAVVTVSPVQEMVDGALARQVTLVAR